MSSMWKVAFGVCAFIGACFTIGAIVGKVRSPKYAELREVQDKVELDVRLSSGLVRNSALLGAGVIADWDTLVTATFSAGRYEYIWQNQALPIEAGKSCDSISPNLKKCQVGGGGHTPVIKREGMSDVALAGLLVATGIPTSWQFKNIEPVIESKNGIIYALSLVGGAVGFFAGYKIGYKDIYDPDSEKFQAVLTDPRAWRDIVTNKLARAARQRGVVPLHLLPR